MKNYISILALAFVILTGCSTPEGPPRPNERTPFISLSVNEIILDTRAATRQQASLVSNGMWTATVVPETAGSWLFVSPRSGRGGNSTVTISVAENLSGADRSAQIVFSLADGTSDRVRVEQSQDAALFINVDDNSHTVNPAGGTFDVVVTYSTESYTTNITPQSANTWITRTGIERSPCEDRLTFTVSPWTGSGQRTASIVFSSPDGTQNVAVLVTQSETPVQGSYSDGDYVQLQRATVGAGINLIIMGDGYTENEINTQRIYERDMRAAMEDFFSVYPYDAYQQYFNVWMVVGVSNQSGPSVGNNTRDTRFGTWITGEGTNIELRNENVVTNFATSIPGVPQNEGLLTVMLILNSPIYAGTCIMYSSGYSIAMCPRIESTSPNTNARAVVIHECGGHGFGQLADEYVYGGTIPASEQAQIRQWQTSVGAFRNVDFTSDRTQVLWRNFFNYPKYTTGFTEFRVGVFQGGLTYANGVYRPEQNSCMNNNIDYYNAPSRYEIVSRIMSLSGVDTNFTLAEFEAQDNPRVQSYGSLDDRWGADQGLGSPILRD